MDMKGIETWIEENPGKSVLIGGGLLIFILWLLGYFSSSAPAADNTQSSLAAAYYAAEAQQAVVGGQIQMANISATASTAQAGINANAATAINASNANAAMTINGQNASAATTINAAQVGGAVSINTTLGQDALLATQNNNATLSAINQQNVTGQEFLSSLNAVAPSELATLGGEAWSFNLPGVPGQAFNVGVNAGAPGSPDYYIAGGYSPADAAILAMPPAPSAVGVPGSAFAPNLNPYIAPTGPAPAPGAPSNLSADIAAGRF